MTREPTRRTTSRPALSADPTDRAAALHERAQLHRDQGEPAAARQLLLRALGLFEAHAGKRHPDVANVLLELAAAQQELGAYAQAQAQVRRALAILRPLRGDVDFDRLRAQALARRGSLHVARGELRRAEKPLQQALAIAREELLPDDVVSAMNDLGILYKYTGRHSEAARLYRSALSIARRKGAPADATIASLLHNLGGLEHARRRFARAEPLAREGLQIRVRACGPEHLDVAADRAALAAILDARGKREEAEALYRSALEVFTRTLGRGHFEVGFNLGQLAALCHGGGRLGEAAKLYVRALRIQRRVLGPHHPGLALTITNFAALRRAQGRTQDAALLYREAHAIYRAALGARHPDTLLCAADDASMRRSHTGLPARRRPVQGRRAR